MKKNILIAEDDSSLRAIYVKKFATAGFAIRTAEDGEEAVRMVKAEAPDIMILDIHMPKMDGFHVLEALPKKKRDFSIILLTNFDQSELRAKAKELGADDYYVKKDMTIRSLLDMVNRLVGGGSDA